VRGWRLSIRTTSQFQRDLSDSYDRLGGLQERSDPILAREWYLKGLRTSKRLVDLEPENIEFQRDLAVAYCQLGWLEERSNPGQASGPVSKGAADLPEPSLATTGRS